MSKLKPIGTYGEFWALKNLHRFACPKYDVIIHAHFYNHPWWRIFIRHKEFSHLSKKHWSETDWLTYLSRLDSNLLIFFFVLQKLTVVCNRVCHPCRGRLNSGIRCLRMPDLSLLDRVCVSWTPTCLRYNFSPITKTNILDYTSLFLFSAKKFLSISFHLFSYHKSQHFERIWKKFYFT